MWQSRAILCCRWAKACLTKARCLCMRGCILPSPPKPRDTQQCRICFGITVSVPALRQSERVQIPNRHHYRGAGNCCQDQCAQEDTIKTLRASLAAHSLTDNHIHDIFYLRCCLRTTLEKIFDATKCVGSLDFERA